MTEDVRAHCSARRAAAAKPLTIAAALGTVAALGVTGLVNLTARAADLGLVLILLHVIVAAALVPLLAGRMKETEQ